MYFQTKNLNYGQYKQSDVTEYLHQKHGRMMDGRVQGNFHLGKANRQTESQGPGDAGHLTLCYYNALKLYY